MWPKKDKAPEPDPQWTFRMRPCYSFEFHVIHNKPHFLFEDSPVALFKWDLFFNSEHVGEGEFQLFMNEPRVEQKVFMEGFKQATKHYYKQTATGAFPYAEGGVHVLRGATMDIDGDIAKEYEDWLDNR